MQRQVRNNPLTASRPGGLIGLVALVMLLAGLGNAQAASVGHHNLADLLDHSEAIVVGQVQDMRDGFDANGVPYTEVTLKVAEQIRGQHSGDGELFTFRQFGLLQPRTMPDGRVNVNVTPDGWSQYGIGEELVLFLSDPARHTGLRTTVGLAQGKVAIRNGQIRLQGNNAGLFRDLSFSRGALSGSEQEMIENAHSTGKADAQEFLRLVRKASREQWVNNGRIKHEG